MKSPNIFLSYSWDDKTYADRIYHDLTIGGLTITKDDNVLRYTDNVASFMESIANSDFAILLISDSYLRSFNCMTEVLRLIRNENKWHQILPVIGKNCNIYSISDRLQYVQYWEYQYMNIEKSLSSLKPENVVQTLEELSICKEIAASIDSFLVKIKNQLNTSIQALFDTFYAPLFEKIKINPDYQLMARVVSISFIKDPTKRLNSIIRLQKRRPDIAQNATILGIIASSYRDLGQPTEAVKYYKAALSSDAMYYAAWNNLGRIYQLTYLNYEEAKKAFEKAIECKPDFDIPRLNLGVLLSSEFKDYDGAKKQYEEILKFDVNNPKAHHNLSNIYRANDFRDLDRAEYHLKIAVRQNLLEAVLSYANFLKVHRKEIEMGNQYYLKAKQLDVHGLYSREIELMLKSTRG